MISGLGLSSSGIASALRTATGARATMDDMTRQIATGQKVSSVKDDGAAWARAAGLKSDVVQWSSRLSTLDRIETGLEYTRFGVDTSLSAFGALSELVLAARSSVAGSTAREALAAQWNHTTEWTRLNAGPNVAFEGFTGYVPASGGNQGYQMDSTDPFWVGNNFAIYPNQYLFDNWMTVQDALRPVALRGFDIAGASTTDLDDAATTLTSLTNAATNWALAAGADERTVEVMRTRARGSLDATVNHLGAITDADLGNASIRRAQADSRQQLALSTVRQALDTYATYAGGLLGNVQRTQRAIV